MKEEAGTLPPCMFPVLTSTATDPGKESISIPIPGWEASLPAENEDCVCALLGAAWALVLYQFARAEEIAFLICGGSDEESTRVVTALIQADEAVKQLLDDCKPSSALPYQRHHHDQINSGLLVILSKDDVKYSKCLIGLLIDFPHRSVSLRFHPQLVDKHLACFVAAATAQAIRGIVADPDQEMRAVSLFHEQHFAQVVRWNERHPIPSPSATSVYELLQPLCQSRADSPAICAWDGEITYGELDTLTGQLTGRLQAMNVRPNTVVALCFEKSLWAVLSMLSVIRTGAAFVFLDPSHPPAHRQLLLSQACPVLLMTSESQQQLFDNDAHPPVLIVTPTLLSQLSSHSPPDVFKPPNELHDPALLVFTSGSSGTPKGCLMDHGSLAGIIPLGREWPFDATCNRIFQFAPFVFGTSYLEIFSALLTGGVLCIASDHEWKNDLVGAISRMQTTGLVLPPSLAKVTSPDLLPTVRMLAMGGEPLDASLLDRWADRVRLVQAYGMSENAGVLTFNPIVTRGSNARNVGQSSNCRLWLVNPDDHHQLAPVGAVGELLFEGAGIARKYLSHPELSAATFVEWPAWRQQFTTLSGRGRFLKTGDLARYNADGTINHLGRKDSQVKIRGQRVDLKEIELLMRPQFGPNLDIVVELVLPKGSTPILAAFLCSKDINSLSSKSVDGHGFVVLPTSLRARIQLVNSSLRRSLPDYMLPVVYLLLAVLPTTITGKMDRRGLREKISALTRAELDNLMHGQPFEMLPPSTPMEKRLVGLMADTLQLECAKVAVNTSFLKLGGDSISAMAFVRKCQSEHIVITVQDIFQAPTIASLAERAQVINDKKIVDLDQKSHFGLTLTQRHILSVEQSPTGSGVVLELQQQTSSQVANAIRSLVTQHPVLRSRFVVLENSEARQIVMDAVDDGFLFEECEIKRSEDLEYLRETAIRLLDPYRGPVFGAYLIQSSGGKQMLLLVAHDVIVDSLSWVVLQNDLEQLLCGNTLRDVPSFQEWYNLIKPGDKQNYIFRELASEGWARGDCDSNIAMPRSNLKHLRGQTAALDSETCHLLFGDGRESLQVRPWQIILAALSRSFYLVFCDHRPPSLAANIDGRDIAYPSLDFTHAAGRFDSVLFCPGPRNLGQLTSLDLVRRIMDSTWLSLVDGMARPLPATVDILFHNLITSDTSMGLPDRSLTKHMPSSRCSGVLELVASGAQKSGTIELSYAYSEVLGDEELLNHWFSQFLQSLAEILDDVVKASTIFTLANFQSLPLNYEELNRLETEHFPKIGFTKHVELCDTYLCSPIQEGMLLAQAGMPSRYKVSARWRAVPNNQQGKVCIERLKVAWSAVVYRHPSLRTVFVPHPHDNNEHIQLVLSTPTADNAAKAVNNFDDLSMHGAESNFPIAQMTLQRLPSDEVDCRLKVDHAVVDGISLQILMRDLALAYDHVLPARSLLPFRQYIIQQENVCKGDSKAYWATRLEDCPPCQFPVLTGKGKNIPGRSANFCSVKIELEALSGLYDLSHKYGFTMANIFQVAWALVLQTYTSQMSVCFGYMVAGRNSSEDMWDTVGLYANMIIRTIDLNPTKSLLDVLQTAQQDFADSLPYHQISASEIFAHLGVSSRHLFNTMLSFVHVIEDRSESVRSLRLEATDMLDHSEYDIALDGMMQGEKITARIKYWDSILNRDQAQTLTTVFQQALDVLATSSRQPLGEIYLLSDRDTRQIMEWNTSLPETVNGCIHAYIDEQAKIHPLASAVQGWNGSFTYQELSILSSCLAKHLSELGVHPGEIVPLCLEKTCWTPVAMLAVLKAGAAFVLLNPSLHSQRLQNMCQVIGARTILTSRQNAALCAELGINFIVIEEQHWTSNSNGTKDWVPPAICGEDLAYIVFTSGSTGTPKCAMIQHSAFLSSALSYGPYLQLNNQSRTFQQCSYSFDISISDHLATLLAGGCVCIPSDEELKNDMSTAIRKFRSNWAMITPSVSRILQCDSLPCLKTLCLIGEALTASDIRSWSKHVTLINTYGPAETACVSHSSLALAEGDESKCIGNGLGAVSWIVCQDDPERLMPVGTVGELLIDGPIVGKGYLKDPEKTNAAFIDCPSWMSSMRPGYQAKLYKTGDLVRYMDDGSILFCGRKNTQVKVRGQWVELSEVENYSRQCFPGPSQSVVEYVEDQSLLVGFVTWQDGRLNDKTGTSSILLPDNVEFQQSAVLARRRMLDLVPEHMIPAAFIPVSQIPLGPTGKADRQQFRDILYALPPQTLWKYVAGAKEIVVPSTSLEARLQQVYASVLRAPAEMISVEDDFFHLGGNSLAAMKIFSGTRIDGLQISFADVFQHRTIRRLARSIESAAPATLPVIEEKDVSASRPILTGRLLDTLSLMQISKADIEDFLPCTPLQTMMLRAQLYETEVYTLRFSVQITSDSLSVQATYLQEAWQTVIDRHAILRTLFVPTEEENVYSQAILTHKAALHSLTKLPYQVAFTQDTHNTVTLTGQMSHAVGDAASTAIILDDLRRIYSNDVLETAAPQFSQYVQYVDTSSKRSMEYWLGYFLGASPCLFPYHHTDIRGHPRSVPVSIKKDFGTISRSCQQGEITVPTLIKSVWAMALALWTRTDSVCFGYLVSGRDVPIAEVENIVGPLLNLLVCRLDLKLQHSLGHVLGDVQSDYAQSLCYQPGMIPALKQMEQAMSRPLFNTVVNHRQFLNSNPNSLGDSDLYFQILSLTDPMDYDIVVDVNQVPNDIKITLNYWDARISEGTMANLASSFDAILTLFVTNPLLKPLDVLKRFSCL